MGTADVGRLVGDPSQVQAAAAAVRERTTLKPQVGLVLGSGLGALAEEVDGVTIPYGELPGMPVSSAPGHAWRGGWRVPGTSRNHPSPAPRRASWWSNPVALVTC